MKKPYLWQEDPALINLYEAEIGVLNRGLDGEFELLRIFDAEKSQGKVIAIGNLWYSKTHNQTVQISFPTTYPTAAPKVISVKVKLTDKGEISSPVEPFSLGKGNQYNDGSFCLFPKNFWNPNEHNIGWILRRAQRWLKSANSKGGFKKEEIVEEYPVPLNHRGQVLLPRKIVLPDSAKTGEMVLSQFKPNNYILVDNQLTNSPFRLHINTETFRWYKFPKSMSFKKLFPSLDAQTLINIFRNYFGENLMEGPHFKCVAFFLPAEKNQWHFFKLNTIQQGMMSQIQISYFLSRTISEELYLRTATIFNDKILLKKRVTILGLGAIGSEVARSLSRNSIGHFNLFDNDTFELGNSVRHAGDLFYIGEKKVDVAKSLIQLSNPNITVNPYHIDVLDDTSMFFESLKESDLCLVLTGEDPVDYFINDKYSTQFSIPFVFARVSAGGVSGSIQVVQNGSACLRCLSNQGLDYLPKPKEEVNYAELPPEYGSCSLPAVPGSEIDTKEIALHVSRISLQLLLKDEKNSNYPGLMGMQYYWHGPYGSDRKKPFTWETSNHPKDVSCKICGK